MGGKPRKSRRKPPGPPPDPRAPAPVRLIGAEQDDPIIRGRVVDALLRMIDGEEL